MPNEQLNKHNADCLRHVADLLESGEYKMQGVAGFAVEGETLLVQMDAKFVPTSKINFEVETSEEKTLKAGDYIMQPDETVWIKTENTVLSVHFSSATHETEVCAYDDGVENEPRRLRTAGVIQKWEPT
jgi:hypothetical protein